MVKHKGVERAAVIVGGSFGPFSHGIFGARRQQQY
jgi:hypothetical protein